MKDKFFPYLVLITAFLVSSSAAYYSIFGLSRLFAGAATEVIVMAASLEIAKIVSASLLQRYWSDLHIFKRIYLTFTVVILILITSAGIYGFLSGAYQVTANKDSIVEKRIELLESKKSRYVNQKSESLSERDKILSDITQLRASLSNPNQIQYIDPKTKQVITTTSSAARKSLETQLSDAISRRDLLSNKIDVCSDSISEYETRVIDAKASSSTSNELGPLKYLSGLTGKPMDSVVNWFLILIVFVFDPLAIVLFVTANFLFLRKPTQVKPEPDNKSQDTGATVIAPSPVNISNSNEPAFDWKISSGSVILADYDWGSHPSVLAYSGSGFVTSSGILHNAGLEHDIANDNPIITVPVVKPEIPVITVERVTDDRTRKIFDSDLSQRLANNIRKALPWWKPSDSGSSDYDNESKDETLSERQIQNMTHEEVQSWYKKRRNANK